MEIKKCMRCMQDIDSDACPHCGFTSAGYHQPSNALSCGSILNARYLVGVADSNAEFLYYAAFDLQLEKAVRITAFPADAALAQSFENIVRRAMALSAVSSVNHVQQMFREDGVFYAVTEQDSVNTLHNTIQRSGTMSWERVSKIFAAAARTIQAVHAAGFVHGNLDPDHLLLTDHGVVIQLDLSTLSQPGQSCAGLAGPSKTFGAPEALQSSGSIGTWTDVYSLTATMLYALTGTLPPSAAERAAGKSLRLDMPPFSKLPGSVVAALRCALEEDPKERTAQMDQLLNGILPQNAAKPLSAATSPTTPIPVPARAATPISGMPRQKKKKKILFPVTAAVLAALALGGYGIYKVNQSNHYQAAAAAYEAEDYAAASEQFHALGSYKDSEEFAQSADQHLHYAAGLKAQEEGAYENAIAELNAAPDIAGVDQKLGECYMSLGQEHLQKKTYLSAMQAFTNAKEYNAKDAQAYYTYADGLNDLSKKQYESAITKLTQNLAVTKDKKSAQDAYENRVNQLLNESKFDAAEETAKKFASFCTNNKCDSSVANTLFNNSILAQAEALYHTGYLTKARDTFQRASEGTVYNNINRDERLKKLEKHAKLLSMEGDWISTSGKSTLSSGRITYYYTLKDYNQLPFSIRFILNDDDTITASGSCTWLSCANLYTISKESFQFSSKVNLNSISVTGVEGVQSGMTVTYNAYGDALSIDFRSEDHTHVRYTYTRGK